MGFFLTVMSAPELCHLSLLPDLCTAFLGLHVAVRAFLKNICKLRSSAEVILLFRGLNIYASMTFQILICK